MQQPSYYKDLDATIPSVLQVGRLPFSPPPFLNSLPVFVLEFQVFDTILGKCGLQSEGAIEPVKLNTHHRVTAASMKPQVRRFRPGAGRCCSCEGPASGSGAEPDPVPVFPNPDCLLENLCLTPSAPGPGGHHLVPVRRCQHRPRLPGHLPRRLHQLPLPRLPQQVSRRRGDSSHRSAA